MNFSLMLYRSDIKYADFDYPIDHLPSSLTHLRLDGQITHSLDTLPSSLTYLELGLKNELKINKFPPSLLSLVMNRSLKLNFR